MTDSKHKDLLRQYSKNQSIYQDFVHRLENLIEDLLAANDIDFHVIEGRAKSIESVREKISRPGKKYSDPLKDLPDLAGIRIVAYDKDNLERIASVINSEFEVDDTSSADKSKELSPDQFGYLSVHKIISLPNNRTAMTEWQRFTELHAEIQIRTVLQHAWASISHKLQYKRESEIPSNLRRRLTRLAGLFELADDEFLALRSADLETRVQIKNQLKSESSGVSLDLVSTQEWFTESKYWNLIKNMIEMKGCSLIHEVDDEIDGFEQLLDVATKLSFKSIKELEDELEIVLEKGQDYFKTIQFDMAGDPPHFGAILLMAGNQHIFSKYSMYPFSDIEYIDEIKRASEIIFKEK